MAQERFDFIDNFMHTLDIMDYWMIRLGIDSGDVQDMMSALDALEGSGIEYNELVYWATVVY